MGSTFNNPRSDLRSALSLQIDSEMVRGVAYRREDGKLSDCHFAAAQWRHHGAKLHSPEGIRGLTQAVRTILQQLPRNLETASISLSGEFCVTRVVSDTNDNVLQEVREIEDRSRLYLSLGHGPKVVAGSIIPQDSRHQHATVSVVHRETIEAILGVAKAVGLNVAMIEPSVISLCRLMAALKVDRDAPLLLVSPTASGVEIAITFQGRLYLDYRPAAVDSQKKIADVLVNHLQRLKRYCRRHARVMQQSIESVYLSGDHQRTADIQEGLGDALGMPVHFLETSVQKSDFAQHADSIPATHLPAVGLALLGVPGLATPGPNLMERLSADAEESITPQLFKVFGPIAATLMAAAVFWFVISQQSNALDQRLEAASALESIHRETIQIQAEMRKDRELLAAQQNLDQQLVERPLGTWSQKIGDCLPESAWLTSMHWEQDGTLIVTGNAFAEPTVFDFAQSVRQLPFITRASIAGVLPNRTKAGEAVKFTIHCDLNGQEDSEEEDDGSI